MLFFTVLLGCFMSRDRKLHSLTTTVIDRPNQGAWSQPMFGGRQHERAKNPRAPLFKSGRGTKV